MLFRSKLRMQSLEAETGEDLRREIKIRISHDFSPSNIFAALPNDPKPCFSSTYDHAV
jgi:hypothetical protein